MSKFLTAPQWYDAGGGLNKSLDVNCHGSDTATAFGKGANSLDDCVSVGYQASSGGFGSVSIGKNAKANYQGGCIAIGNAAACVQNSEPSRRIQFLSRGISVVKANEIGFGPDSLLDLIYPIGSIYISVSSTDPGTIFGGTWEAFATGKTLVGVDAADTDFNASGKEGGSKTVTLTTEQMPAHQHYFEQNIRGVAQNVKLTQTTNQGSPEKNVVKAETGATMSVPERSGWSENYDGGDFRTTNIGGNEPHNNMPPYITVYMWKRTA